MSKKLYKLVIFVPKTHLEKVRSAICEKGAGHIGNYDYCTFVTHGIGTFRGLKGANPTIGKIWKIERVKEARLETIVPKNKIKQVLAAMKKAHPYEEIAYDVYQLSNEDI